MKTWVRLRETLVHGIGAGLVAAAIVGLVDSALLIYVDQTFLAEVARSPWESLKGLPHALVTYGSMGMLGGLCLVFLPGLGIAWHSRGGRLAQHLTWDFAAALLIMLGTLVVVVNRVSRDLTGHLLHLGGSRPDVPREKLILVTVSLALGLLLLQLWLSRRTRIPRVKWSVGLYLALLLAALLVSGVLGFASRLAAQSPGLTPTPESLRDQPNILFVTIDALRADHLSSYGHAENETPYLDALAQDAVLYRQMSAQSSWTKPSVATMLTSLYPSSHQVIGGQDLLPDSVTTLPEVLQALGYYTVAFSSNAYISSSFNFDQGYDEYEFLSADYPFLASDYSSRFAAFSLLRALRSLFVPATAHPHNEYVSNAETVGAEALTWLGTNHGSRFFMYLHYMDPHDPYFAHPYDGTSVSRSVTPDPPPSQAPFMRRLYDEEIAFNDAHLGELFDRLKAWGLYDDMLIIVTSDHGEEFQEHGGWWHSFTLYEEVLAVPLIIKYPGNAYAGTTIKDLARSLDIAPTVLDVVGAPVPEAMQGVSLSPGTSHPPAEFSVSELGEGGSVRAIRGPRYKLIIAAEDNPQGLPTEALFDLQVDPAEQVNLAEEMPAMTQSLRAALEEIVASAEAQAVERQSGDLDPKTRDQLQKLGY